MVSRALAGHVARTRFHHLPAVAVTGAKQSLLDAIGVSLAASRLGEGCGAFIDLARGSPGPCTVLGAGFSAAVLPAVLANGALAHALDYEDAYDGAPIHPNAAVVPAALALAQARGASGRELITAVAVGADLVCRLGLALTENPDVHGFYPPPLLSAFGAAAAAASLLNLDEDQTLGAFALTLSQAAGSAQFKQSPHSHVRAIRDAFSAHAGVLSAQLAAAGVRGFDEPLEGKAGFFQLYARGAYDPARLLANLGEVFEGANVSYKPWPTCRGTHAFIEAALDLMAEAPPPLDTIAEIRVTGGEVQRMLAEPFAQKARPSTAIDAKFSIPFTVATALVRGGVALADFEAAALRDEAVLTLAARCHYLRAPTTGSDLAEATGGLLEIVLADGAIRSRRVEHPRGHPTNPISAESLRVKFVDCARKALQPLAVDAAARLAEHILNLENLEGADGLFSSVAPSAFQPQATNAPAPSKAIDANRSPISR